MSAQDERAKRERAVHDLDRVRKGLKNASPASGEVAKWRKRRSAVDEGYDMFKTKGQTVVEKRVKKRTRRLSSGKKRNPSRDSMRGAFPELKPWREDDEDVNDDDL